jgi:hypothetical protein
VKTTRAAQVSLLTLLCSMADEMAQSRATRMSREAIAVMRDRVRAERQALLDDDEPALIDYEATMLVECLAEVTYARADRDARRESRVVAYLNSLRTFMRQDLQQAERRLAS